MASLHRPQAYTDAAYGGRNARLDLHRNRRLFSGLDGPLCARLRAVLRGAETMLEPVIGLGVAIVLRAYLVYTLLHPEKF
jgi:K+-transporting ATPase KdpF subunit